MDLTLPAEPLHLSRPDGARLAVYRREPSAAPDVTLILAHGWSASAAVWDDVIRHLPADARMRVLTFDQRGHGASTPGHAPAGISVLADDLQALLSAFSADTPAIVAAHSMGSMAVLMGAARGSRTTPVGLAGLLLVSASSGQIDLRLEGHPPLARVVGSARTAIAEACTRAPRSTRYLRDLLSPSAAPRPATDVAAAWFRAILNFDVAGRLAALEDTPSIWSRAPRTGSSHPSTHADLPPSSPTPAFMWSKAPPTGSPASDLPFWLHCCKTWLSEPAPSSTPRPATPTASCGPPPTCCSPSAGRSGAADDSRGSRPGPPAAPTHRHAWSGTH